MLLAKSGNIVHRNIGHHSIDHLVDYDLYSERRMEDDTDRRAGPEHRKNHLRDKLVHDNFDLDAAHSWRYQEKHVYDASMGNSGLDVSSRSISECSIHIHNVLRESRGNKWNSVARHWPYSCRNLRLLVVGSVQLLPISEIR